MSEVILARARVEPGKADRLRDWYAELEDRLPEVRETLRHEGVYTETAFLQSHGEETYLYVYMESADIETALAAGDEEAYEIDEQHHEVLGDALTDGWEDLEPIGHFTNPERSGKE